jgi:predicted metalloprotease
MRWRGRRGSSNVEDRRRMGGPVMAGGGLGMIALIVIVALMGGDPTALLQDMTQQVPGGGATPTAEEDELAQFVSVVLADTEDVWRELFARRGMTYQEPTLVIFTGRVNSACGLAGAAVGPFYCPADRKLYIDLSFYEQMRRQLGAPGDFAQAYVIAHEVGHHVQNLLGASDKLHSARGRVSETEYNRMSVRLELQADFYAGVWAHHAQRMRNVLETGDIEEALNAASAIGDDKLQRQSTGTVRPDSFTHGTSAQRVRWFRHGFETGDPAAGDTFDEANFQRVEAGR